ncbi:MAG: FMN-binding glutamate synthase family protein [Polyangiaceae bacterium]|nr:FMN-binding glutamate synthase family protein [Polyangiaceae bacterium]MCW5791491.1 FMN-binding glutamate synthase family protein [Polyangiaceae bacterium]
MARRVFWGLSIATVSLLSGLTLGGEPPLWIWLLTLPLLTLGLADALQRKHSLLRNYPVLGHARYALEKIRPEIRQYFGESDLDGRPFDRETRSVVYQRAKGEIDSVPFGSKRNLMVVGAEWIPHSMAPEEPLQEAPRVLVGEGQCKQPYSISRFNIAAMSYGALSHTAITALNRGAARGGFAHNTGEGGVSSYHLEAGGDLIWQIGTAYFGCRTLEGEFHPGRFVEMATHPSIKMVEIKLSQGAKPGYGGILPAKKVTPEIAKLRQVPVGKAVNSPPGHSAFHTPIELLEFVDRLRELSGGKPVGLKMCVGKVSDLFCLFKAMLETGRRPDYISIDGAEAGTGAAPLEFTNYVGMPLDDGLFAVHAGLTGVGLRDQIKVFVAGRIVTGYDMFRMTALGADGCFSGRGMMLALGCIQALRCHMNDCPVGVATQDPALASALDPADKAVRVQRYHQKTVQSFLALMNAAGVKHPDDIAARHMRRRTAEGLVVPLAAVYPEVAAGSFLRGEVPAAFAADWETARAEAFVG